MEMGKRDSYLRATGQIIETWPVTIWQQLQNRRNCGGETGLNVEK